MGCCSHQANRFLLRLFGARGDFHPINPTHYIHSLFVHLQLQLLCSAIFSLCKFFNAPSFTLLINSVYNDCIIIMLCWFKGQGKKGVCVSKGCAVAHILLLDQYLFLVYFLRIPHHNVVLIGYWISFMFKFLVLFFSCQTGQSKAFLQCTHTSISFHSMIKESRNHAKYIIHNYLISENQTR